jgi:hypothetical protein
MTIKVDSLVKELVRGEWGRVLGGENNQSIISICYMYIHIWNSITKPNKYCLERGQKVKGLRKFNRGGKFGQNALYTWLEISQWNHFV